MSAMLIRCYKLIIQNFNSSNVTDMSSMFQDCHNLINLDLSKFDTKNVTNTNESYVSRM